MKKNLWIWAIAALSMAACTSEDVPTTEQIVTENDWISPDGRVVVQLGAESSPSVTVSRAPIEGDKVTSLTDLGIFAINRDEYISSAEWEEWPKTIDNCLLKNVKAQGANKAQEGSEPVEVDPLDSDVNTGKKVTLFDTNASQAGAVYYYPIQGSQNYDFYGYHPYQNSENIHFWENKESKQIPGVEINLDGDVDLITGKAEQATQILENEIYVTEHTGTTAPQLGTSSNPIDGYNAKYVRKIKYSNWIIDEWNKTLDQNATKLTGKKPFIPVISFKHRLTKLNFQIITAQEQAGDGNQSETEGGDRVDAKNLRVKNVGLVNVHRVARLFIEQDMTLNYIGRKEKAENALPMIMKDETNTDIWENEKIIPQEYKTETNPEYTSAGYLMVPATKDISDYERFPYQISLVVEANNSTGIPTEQNIVLDLKDENGDYLDFEAGKSYNIRIALYALQEVFVNATLTDWDSNTQDIYIPVE